MPPVLTALGAVRAKLAEVATDRCWSLSDVQVDAALCSVVAARAQLDELGLRLLATAKQRGLGGATGSASMASWWAARSGRARGAAGADVRLADSLDRDLDSGGLEYSRAALAAGTVSVEQVAVIDRAMAGLPSAVASPQRAGGETFLIEQAAGREGAARLAADHADPALTAFTRVEPGPLGSGPKELTRLGRRHSSTSSACTSSACTPTAGTGSAGTGGTSGGSGPVGQAAWAGSAPGWWHSDVLAAGLGVGATRAGEADTTPTTLGYDQRLGLALCELLEHVLLDGLPQSGGVAATIPAWCEAHHLIPWSRGGRTDVSDGCLLCPFHHHLIHTGQWSARMGPDGVPEVIPPARIDPTRNPTPTRTLPSPGPHPATAVRQNDARKLCPEERRAISASRWASQASDCVRGTPRRSRARRVC